MPIFLLDEEIRFPEPAQANKEGLLAVGGDLSPERLLLAYSKGIFPWYSDDNPILWWSPDPRMVLFPNDLKVHKSLRQTLNLERFIVTFDKHFREVMTACSEVPRPGQEGTWISQEMIEAYARLHELGYAHSVEVMDGDTIAGGLYGISLGGAFFGESMFHNVRDASKVALYYLVERLKLWDFTMIDAQQRTRHLKSLGAKTIHRKKFLTILEDSLTRETILGPWDK